MMAFMFSFCWFSAISSRPPGIDPTTPLLVVEPHRSSRGCSVAEAAVEDGSVRRSLGGGYPVVGLGLTSMTLRVRRPSLSCGPPPIVGGIPVAVVAPEAEAEEAEGYGSSAFIALPNRAVGSRTARVGVFFASSRGLAYLLYQTCSMRALTSGYFGDQQK